MSLDILARLTHVLEADPGDWFVLEMGIGSRGFDTIPYACDDR